MMFDRIIDMKNQIKIGHSDSIVQVDILKEEISRSIVVLVDNIAKYYLEDNHKEVWDLEHDFPNIALPWPSIWFEWAPTKFINSDIHGCQKVVNSIKKYGVFIRTFPNNDKQDSMATAVGFMERYDGIWIVPMMITLQITKDGKFKRMSENKNESFLCTPLVKFKDNELFQINVDYMALLSHIPFLAISFAHCKNIAIKEVRPANKLNARRIKKGKKPLNRYYILEIDSMKEVLKKDGAIEKNGLRRALHICRGHFATYTQDAPLFGRVTGTFWKPMHVRGNAKEGVVVKDYKINPPSTSPPPPQAASRRT